MQGERSFSGSSAEGCCGGRGRRVAAAGAEPDLTLAEIAGRPGEVVSYRPPPSVVHDFFKRRGVTRKERRHFPFSALRASLRCETMSRLSA